MTTAVDLLSGIRGRRLCFELARRGVGGAEVGAAMFAAARHVDDTRGDRARGSVAYVVAGPTSAPGAGVPPLPVPSLVEALTAAGTATAVRPDHLLHALADTVTSAMGWQAPDSEDVVLAGPAVTATLVPVAEAVLEAPETAWWSTPLDRAAQVRTEFEGTTPTDASTQPRTHGPTGERLHRWRDAVLEEERRRVDERAGHPDVLVGGTWWVTPALAGLELTTRALGAAGSAALWLTEDDAGWRRADLVPYAVEPTARVLEITGPEDWAALVAAYPLDVTVSRQPDWFGAVAEREGAWLIPDWAAVAERYDGVHVSVLGWLTTSGVSVPAGRGATTTLTGWSPDATWWLADVIRAEPSRERWVLSDRTWRPDAPVHQPAGDRPRR